MDTREWFDKADYSDLTIRLSDGTEFKVHKVIVCQANEYFHKLCGPESRFVESKQHTIELKDDDPAALRSVLRHIYKLPVLVNVLSHEQWRFWLNISIVADKYLEKYLSETAKNRFRALALAETSADKIFDIVETINTYLKHDDEMVKLADKLRKDNLGKLLKNDRFRAELDSGGKEMMWQILDDLIFATDLKEKQYHLCDLHEKLLLQDPVTDKPAVCAVCCTKATRTVFDRIEYPGRTVWAPQ